MALACWQGWLPWDCASNTRAWHARTQAGVGPGVWRWDKQPQRCQGWGLGVPEGVGTTVVSGILAPGAAVGEGAQLSVGASLLAGVGWREGEENVGTSCRGAHPGRGGQAERVTRAQGLAFLSLAMRQVL